MTYGASNSPSGGPTPPHVSEFFLLGQNSLLVSNLQNDVKKQLLYKLEINDIWGPLSPSGGPATPPQVREFFPPRSKMAFKSQISKMTPKKTVHTHLKCVTQGESNLLFEGAPYPRVSQFFSPIGKNLLLSLQSSKWNQKLKFYTNANMLLLDPPTGSGGPHTPPGEPISLPSDQICSPASNLQSDINK